MRSSGYRGRSEEKLTVSEKQVGNNPACCRCHSLLRPQTYGKDGYPRDCQEKEATSGYPPSNLQVHVHAADHGRHGSTTSRRGLVRLPHGQLLELKRH